MIAGKIRTTIPRAESKGESEDKLNAKGSVDSRSHVTILKELIYGNQGVDPKARKLDERGSLKLMEEEKD